MKKCKEYWIYIVLCLVCIAVRVLPLSIGAEYDEAINDIAIGGFASTLVAWIIKVNDNVANEKETGHLGVEHYMDFISRSQNIWMLLLDVCVYKVVLFPRQKLIHL